MGKAVIEKIKNAAIFAWDVLVPRFITEDVAIKRVGNSSSWDEFEIVCSLADVDPGEQFDGIATVDCFQFLGIGISYRIGNFRPWSSR